MKKIKINSRPIQTITLEFNDDIQKQVKFSNYAMLILDEEFEGSIPIIAGAFKKPYAAGAKLLYAGMKACDDTVQFDDVKSLVVGMDLDVIMQIIQQAADSIVQGDADADKKKVSLDSPEMQQILKMMNEAGD